MSSTCFEHTSVHPQEDLYIQFYGISFMHPHKHCGRCRMSLVLDTRLACWDCIPLVERFPDVGTPVPKRVGDYYLS